MIQIETLVKSPHAPRYLPMLCRHFSRKVPARHTETHGTVDFQPGECLMKVEGSHLLITCKGRDEKEIERIKHIVGSHLTRFGKKENLILEWTLLPPESKR